MNKKIWKRCFIALSSIAGIALIHTLVQACAWGGYEYETAGYSLFPQNLVGKSAYVPFLFDPSQPYFNDSVLSSNPNAKTYSSNTEEWIAYLGSEPNLKEVEALVYKSTVSDLYELRKAVLKQSASLPNSFANNKAVSFLIRKGDAATTDYLIFAKQCEAYTTSRTPDWQSPPTVDTLSMIRAGEEAEAYADKAKIIYLSNRYAFQAIRLAHYSSKYDRCLKLCKKYGNGPARDSYIYRQLHSLEGGALKHLKRYDEARYRFAMMFDRYYSSDFDFYFTNFAYSTPQEWSYDRWGGFTAASANLTDSLSGYQYCKTPHEKAVMLFLDAYSGSRMEVPSLVQLNELEPGSEFADILLARCISELEKSGFFEKQPWKTEALPPDFTYTKADPKALLEAVQGILLKGGLKKTYFWEYAAGHLNYMQKNYAGASAYFKKSLTHVPPGIAVESQVKAMEILMDIELVPRLDAGFEAKEMESLVWMGKNQSGDDKQGFLYQRLGDRYLSQHDSVRAILCYSSSANPVDLYQHPESQPLVRLINFMNRPSKTPFEEYMLSCYKVSLSKVYELYGTVMLRQSRLQEAKDDFALAGELEDLPADPFNMHLKDCHDCDFKEAKSKTYTKGSLVVKLMDLEKVSDIPGPDQANAAFQAGNAYYNMSYYGNTWMAKAYSRSTYDLKDQFPDCSLAAYFYQKAIKASDNNEFKARCVFMLSKCTHNGFFTNGEDSVFPKPGTDKFNEYHAADLALKGSYRDTKFYEEAIGECSWFKDYVKQ
jgi:hypothetical protein